MFSADWSWESSIISLSSWCVKYQNSKIWHQGFSIWKQTLNIGHPDWLLAILRSLIAFYGITWWIENVLKISTIPFIPTGLKNEEFSAYGIQLETAYLGIIKIATVKDRTLRRRVHRWAIIWRIVCTLGCIINILFTFVIRCSTHDISKHRFSEKHSS